MDMQQIVENAPAEWRPMSQRPERAGLCKLRSEYYEYSYFDGSGFAGAWESAEQAMEYRRFFELNNSQGCANRATGWRYADEQAPATEAPVLIGVDYAKGFDAITASDRRGIETFTPPPEVKREPEKVRVSSLRHSRWIDGFR